MILLVLPSFNRKIFNEKLKGTVSYEFLYVCIQHNFFKVSLDIINKFFYVGFTIPEDSFGLLFKYLLPSCLSDGRFKVKGESEETCLVCRR